MLLATASGLRALLSCKMNIRVCYRCALMWHQGSNPLCIWGGGLANVDIHVVFITSVTGIHAIENTAKAHVPHDIYGNAPITCHGRHEDTGEHVSLDEKAGRHSRFPAVIRASYFKFVTLAQRCSHSPPLVWFVVSAFPHDHALTSKAAKHSRDYTLQ